MSSMAAIDSLPDNTVEYYLVPDIGHTSGFDELEDLRRKVNELIVKYCGHLAQYSADYIWHNEQFNLRPIVNETDCYIYGRTCFEENVEDEYFIIFLLRQLTLLDSSLLVRVVDEDGEILLIECANHLEKWAQNGRRAEKRAYLFNGEMHLISPAAKSNLGVGENSANFLKEAYRFIVNNREQTRCDDSIQRCILDRIAPFSDGLRHLQHRANCYLPVSIGLLLEQNSPLIAHAVRAFYLRAADDIKAINTLPHFSPKTCRMTSVKFTRCLYAQLTSQEVIPDKRTEWPISSPDAKDYRARANGYKVTAGFEILISRYLKAAAASVPPNDVNSVETNPFWKKFLDSLESYDYFAGLLVGSAAYRQRLSACKHFFQQTFLHTLNLANADCDFGKQAYDFIQTIDSEAELAKDSVTATEPGDEDDDAWLHLDQAQLDALLAQKFGCDSTDSCVDLGHITKSIPETIKKFVFNENSGMDGAEAPKKAKSKPKKSTVDGADKIDLDGDEFANFVREIQFLVEKKPNLDDLIDDDSTDSCSMEDYGSDNEEFDSDEDEFAATTAHHHVALRNGKKQKSTISSKIDEQIKSSSSSSSSQINEYLKQMDSELASTTMAKSFKCRIAQFDSDDDLDEEEEDEEKQADETKRNTEIDLSILSNILESYNAEADISTSNGPATALFATMGAKLPDIEK